MIIPVKLKQGVKLVKTYSVFHPKLKGKPIGWTNGTLNSDLLSRLNPANFMRLSFFFRS